MSSGSALGLIARPGLISRPIGLGLIGARRIVSIDGPAKPDDEQLPDVDTVAYAIERRLPQFANERRMLCTRLSPRAQTWPLELETAWRRFLDDMHDDLAKVPLGELPRRVLVQTRVAAEFEHDLSVRGFGPAPEQIEAGVKRLFRMVTLHMLANAEINGLTPRPPPGHIAWPVSPVLITSYFGYRKDPVHEAGEGDDVRFHRGLDLGGRKGDPVYAAAQGRVIHAGWLGGYGLTIILQHEGGLSTVYGHLSRALVDLGDEAEEASAIGLVGASGRATGPHLHFEVRRDGTSVDPLDVIGSALGGVAQRESLELQRVASR
ncbi:MAG: M23 family metallopeptidase [Deltaproteobacteria bacterium]|nr:M23 family metallopeptidase [Deltaproteobacteria bacterium]